MFFSVAKETPIENELDVTTPSKPASLVVVEQHIPSGLVSPKDSITLDAASTKAIPPSTRHGSFMTETPSELSTQTPNTTYPLGKYLIHHPSPVKITANSNKQMEHQLQNRLLRQLG